jgi:hypothetical protein
MKRVVFAALVVVLGPAVAVSEPMTLESKIRGYYDAAPEALKKLIERPKVELKVVESLDQLRTFSSGYYNGYAGNIVGRNIAAVAMTHPGKIPTLAFIRSALTRSSDEFAHGATTPGTLGNLRSDALSLVVVSGNDSNEVIVHTIFASALSYPPHPRLGIGSLPPRQESSRAEARLLRRTGLMATTTTDPGFASR